MGDYLFFFPMRHGRWDSNTLSPYELATAGSLADYLFMLIDLGKLILIVGGTNTFPLKMLLSVHCIAATGKEIKTVYLH